MTLQTNHSIRSVLLTDNTIHSQLRKVCSSNTGRTDMKSLSIDAILRWGSLLSLRNRFKVSTSTAYDRGRSQQRRHPKYRPARCNFR